MNITHSTERSAVDRFKFRGWFAPHDTKSGDKIRSRIDEVIRIHDRLLLVLSEHSVASGWAEKEVETAFDKERRRREIVLFPLRPDDTVTKSETGWSADIRRGRHIGDCTDWANQDAYRDNFERLLRDLNLERK